MIKKITITIIGLTILTYSFSQGDSAKIENQRQRIETRIPDSTYWDSIYYDIEHSYGFTIGTNIGNNVSGAEIGFGKINKGVIGSHMLSSGLYIGTEFLWSEFVDKTVLAPKISIWSDAGSSLGAIGLDLIYYSYQNDGQLRLRPQIGLGILGFEIVYGYNIRFGQERISWINDHNFKIIYSFGLFDKKRTIVTNRESFENYKKRKLNK